MSPQDKEKKSFTIIVNAQRKEWNESAISYDQVVQLAFPEPPPPGVVITYTVEYERAEGHKPEGSLVKDGPSAKVKEGMIFGVTETSRS
ncbi:MAG: multiubiquitin domain-containing protein [Myxococcota bacterium]